MSHFYIKRKPPNYTFAWMAALMAIAKLLAWVQQKEFVRSVLMANHTFARILGVAKQHLGVGHVEHGIRYISCKIG